MNTPIETIDYRGVRIEILPDPDPCNPREDENLGTMICWHRRYKLGDLQPKEDPNAVLDDLCGQVCPEYAEAVERLEEIERRLDGWRWSNDLEYLTRQHPVLWTRAKAFVDRLRAQALLNCVMLPVYLMDHSGLSVNTSGFSCPWDSGQVGMIYCSLETARRYWAAPANAGWDWVVYPEEGLPNWLPDGSPLMGLTLREITERSLRDEVRTYDQYLRGEVYGWTAGESSCWGYFGSDVEKSGLLSDAKAAIDAEIGDRRRLHCRRLKTQIKHRVPLGVRTPQAV